MPAGRSADEGKPLAIGRGWGHLGGVNFWNPPNLHALAGLLGWLTTGIVVLAGPFSAVEANRRPPARADAGITNAAVVSVPVPAAVRPGERWFKSFSGDRVDAVLRAGPPTRARVWLDGLPVARHPEVRTHGRPDSPLLQRVLAVNPLVPERWTLTLTDVPPDGSGFGFRAEGSVTGFDGEGRSDREFISTSGRVKLRPEFWADPAGAQDGQVIAWTVAESFLEEVSSGAEGSTVTLVSGLRPAEHFLELELIEGSSLPVSELRVPPASTENPWEPRRLDAVAWWTGAVAAEVTAYTGMASHDTVPLYRSERDPGNFCHCGYPGVFAFEVSLAGTNRILREIRVPYRSPDSLADGWTLSLYPISSLMGEPYPGAPVWVVGGDLEAGDHFIVASLPYNPANILPNRMAIAVEFKPASAEGRAGLLFGLRPVVGDAARLWYHADGVWRDPRAGSSPLFERDPWRLSWIWRNGTPVLRLTTQHPLHPFWLSGQTVGGPQEGFGNLLTDAGGIFEWVPPAAPSARLMQAIPTR